MAVPEKTSPRILRQGDRLADFIVSHLIGQGGFGHIYYVESKLQPGEFYAMKTETVENKRNGILNERRILQQLQGSAYFPRYVDSGHTILYRYLVMEFLGPSLSDMRRVFPDRHFTLSTSLRIGIQSLRALQTIHDRGIVHRDVKPSNFLIRLNSRFPIVLIDFGLARRYISRIDNSILPPRDRAGFVGTTKYASLNAHEGLELGRRDDLISWVFSLFELMTGGLPWPASRDRNESHEAKLRADIPEFCKQLPPQIFEIYEDLQTYGFQERPHYDDIEELLFAAMAQNGCDPEEPFDWERLTDEDLGRIAPLAKLETQHNDYPQLLEFVPQNRRGEGHRERKKTASSSISGSYDEEGEAGEMKGRKLAKHKMIPIASAPLRGRHKESCNVQ
jgi:serine/threonine protein kinase